MKTIILATTMTFLAGLAMAQENIISLNGGYTFVTGDEIDADLTGWRINAVYEYNPLEGAISHGLAFGYASTSGPSTLLLESAVNVEANTFPLYYQPKFMFGNEQVKGFVKGALGWQWSNFERTGPFGTLSGNDSGFMGGGGAGVMFNLGSAFFIQAEYEITWMSNYYVNDGWLNSAMGGVGYRF